MTSRKTGFPSQGNPFNSTTTAVVQLKENNIINVFNFLSYSIYNRKLKGKCTFDWNTKSCDSSGTIIEVSFINYSLENYDDLNFFVIFMYS